MRILRMMTCPCWWPSWQWTASMLMKSSVVLSCVMIGRSVQAGAWDWHARSTKPGSMSGFAYQRKRVVFSLIRCMTSHDQQHDAGYEQTEKTNDQIDVQIQFDH